MFPIFSEFDWRIRYLDQFMDPLDEVLDQLQAETNATEEANDFVKNYLYFFDVKSECNSSRIKNAFAEGKTLLDCPRSEYLIESKQVKQFEGVFIRGNDGKCTIDRKSCESKSPYSMRILRLLKELCQDLQSAPPNKSLMEPEFIAARMGLVGNLKWMKSKQVCLLRSNSHGFTTLHAAAENVQFEAFQMIAEDALHKNPTDKRGITPLHIAAGKGHIKLVEWLLQWIESINGDPNPRSDNGDTPLHRACSSGHLEVVKLISSKIKHINPPGRRDKPLLNIAAISGNHGCLDYLLAQVEMFNVQSKDKPDAQSKTRTSFQTRTEWFEQVPNNTKPILNPSDYLSRIGTFVYVDVDSDEKGYLPIHEACKTGNLKTARKIAKHMLKMGMSTINVPSDNGITPLHLAAKSNKFKLVSWLFTQTDFEMTNLDAKDCDGLTAFDYAMGFNSTREGGLIIEKAKELGFNLFKTDEDRKRPLMVAATHNNIRCVRMLLDPGYGDPIDHKQRYTPECANICKDPDFIELVMVMTLIYGFLEPAEFLYNHNFNINNKKARNPLLKEVGYTPLHFAVRGRELKVIEWMKKDPNLKNGAMQSIKHGSTPLHDACKLGYADIVAMLVDVIDPTLLDNQGKTAMDYAVQFQYGSCKKALKGEAFDPEDYVQYSVMESAICSQNLPLVKWLLNESEDLDQDFHTKCSYGLTPLHWASVMKQESKTDKSIDAGIAEEIIQELSSKLSSKLSINPKANIQMPFKYTVKEQLEN